MDEYQNRRDIDKIYDDLYDQINGSLNVLTFMENSPYKNVASKDDGSDRGTIDAIIDYYDLTNKGGGGGGDLSNYYTKTEINGILSSYVTSDFANTHYAPLVHTHSEYITRAEIHQLDIDLSTLELVPKSLNPNGVICFDNLGENLYIKKSNTSGLVKNDGSIDTTQYLSTLPAHNHDDRYYTESEVDTSLNGKQDALISGTNIKTLNNESLLGSGNIDSPQNVFYGTCSTGATTQIKVVTVDDWSFDTGNILFVKFSNANSYNGTARISIDSVEKDIATVGTTKTSRYYWKSGELVGFVYDGTNMTMLEQGTATTTYYGITKLSSSTSSTSETLSATPKAVKTAYDLANSKQDELVSGTNIKTVNNESLLGSGDIDVLDLIDVDIDMDLMDNGYLKMEANLIERSE